MRFYTYDFFWKFFCRKSENEELVNSGFTLLEVLVVVLVIGSLSAIAAPSYLAFLNIQSLNSAQNAVYRSLQEAKSNSIRQKLTWQVSFREQNGMSQWVIHPQNTNPLLLNWHNLSPTVQIDDAETTFTQSGGIWRVQFNYKGNVNGQLGRVTLASRQGGKAKRCVLTSTLIGAIRTAKENRSPQNGKFCY
ncbi:MAG: prepilin-type N-terminal cleavage/methylation domain-containing protein [Trichocoleus desertorum ATA4-8-CV12]|jgi:prepilin-type N-terminal cleavage/methylation domain-containing protein|nr:prepilin-type N-terminal cleavage/methylation domain-containing protein [Trichocoleus desertorum ATA4-8-CV12]